MEIDLSIQGQPLRYLLEKYPKIVETVKQLHVSRHPCARGTFSLDRNVNNLLNWEQSPQTSEFWSSVYAGRIGVARECHPELFPHYKRVFTRGVHVEKGGLFAKYEE